MSAPVAMSFAPDVVPASAPVAARRGRSVGAIAAGFVTTAALSLGADQVLHVLGVYPP